MSNEKYPVEVEVYEAPKPGKRRRYTTEQKLRLLQECELPGETISGVARRHGISPSMLFQWRRRRDEGAYTAVEAGEDVVAGSEARALKQRIRELERVLGKKTMENEILREAVRIGQEKKLISRGPLLDKLKDGGE